MSFLKNENEINKYFNIGKYKSKYSNQVLEIIRKKFEDENDERCEFQERIRNSSDEDLKLYIPDVYQKSIYNIDYGKLKKSGIKLISFDIDDTITDIALNKINTYVPGLKIKMPEDAKALFKKLKVMGFTLTLLTNANAELASETCKQLKADGFISRANKPETLNFEIMQEQYGVDKSQMAHVGNDMRTDVLGGNRFGITTCLVRESGFSTRLARFVKIRIGLPTKGHILREELADRKLWYKHHQKVKNDQYYQLDEEPVSHNR